MLSPRRSGKRAACWDEPMSDLHFRAATAADVPALVALVTSAYRGESSRAGWTTEADLLDGNRIDPEVLREDLARERSRVLVAERDGAMVACAHVADEGGAGDFGMFAVDPARQGGGLGDIVLREAERIAREEWRLPAMRMTVIDVRDTLIAYYERRGYRRTGIKKPCPYGDERFGIPKRDDLRFEVLEKAL
jgi:ribosomal protein S18 acetylase RimI-like enzyme